MAHTSVTATLSQAGTRLLNKLIDRAQEYGEETDEPIFVVIEHWAREVLNLADLPAIFNAAQDEFPGHAGAKPRWLEALATLFEHGGDGVLTFAENLWRTYLFLLEDAPEVLWDQYPELQRAVMIRTERVLPRTWGDWVLQIQIYMSIVGAHLMAAAPSFEKLLTSMDAVELLGELLPEGALAPLLDDERTFIHEPTFDAATTLMAYLAACADAMGEINPHGLSQVGGASIPLNEVFTPLQLVSLASDSRPIRLVRYQTATFTGFDLAAFQEPLGTGELEARPGLMPSEALARHSRLAILGESGTGKSTLLRVMALNYARALLDDQQNAVQVETRSDGSARIVLAHPLPVYVDLAAYVDDHLPDETLEAFAVRSAVEVAHDPAVAALLGDLLEGGQCLLLLDGLNQVATDEQRCTITETVTDAATRWCAVGNRLVITSRMAGYGAAPLPGDFALYAIRPLDRSQIGPFLLRWSMALTRLRHPLMRDDEALQQAQAGALALVRELTANPQLHSLATTPLMLRMLTEVYRPGMVITPQRVAVYQMVAEALIREWHLPQSASAHPAVLEHEVTGLLAHLAFWLHASRAGGRVGEGELLAILLHIWQQLHPEMSAEQAEAAIQDFTGRLRSSPGPLAELASGQYGFIYESLREYLAARYLVSSYRLASERIRGLLHDPRWDNVIRLAIGFVALNSQEDASDLIEAAVLARGRRAEDLGHRPGPFEDLLRRDLFFAARLLGAGIEARPQVAQAIVGELISLWLGGDRDSLGRFSLIFDSARRHLIHLDGALAGRRAFQLAMDALDDENEHRRAFAADAVTFWPGQLAEALGPLIQDARNAPSLARQAVAQALSRPANLPVRAYELLLMLVSDTDEHVSQAARETLHQAPPVPPEALAIFVDLLRGGAPAGRRVSLRQLEQIGALPNGVINELIYLLNDPDPEIRRGAMEALGGATILPENALMTVCRFAMDTQSGLRLAAIDALRRPVELPQEVINHLVEWTIDPEVAIRRASALALGECLNKSDEVMEALIERLDDPVDSVRADVVEPLALKGRDDPRVMHVLAHAVSDPTHRVRCAIAQSLRHFPRPTAELRKALHDLLSDKEVIVREATIDTIAHLEEPGPELVDYLISLVTVQDFGIGEKAVHALACLRDLPDLALRVLVRALPIHWEKHGRVMAECLKSHGPLGMDIVFQVMDLAVQKTPGRTQATRVPSGLRALALEVLGHALDEAPDVVRVLLEAACEIDSPEAQIAALRGLRNSRGMWSEMKATLLGLIGQGPMAVRCAAGVTLGHLVRSLPDLPFQGAELAALAEAVAGLLRELPPRASWEADARTQNELLLALSWIVTRARPSPPRLTAGK